MNSKIKLRIAGFFIPLLLILIFGVYKIFTDSKTLTEVFNRPLVVTQRQDQAKKILGTFDERGFEQAVVLSVIDGDTIELSDGKKIRYIGIDTPELHHPSRGVQCFGQQAADLNKKLLDGQVVQLEKDVSNTDKFGRLLRYVWLGDELINKKLVREGYAFSRSFPPDIARQNEFKAAETMARIEKKGLWSGCTVDPKKRQTQKISK